MYTSISIIFMICCLGFCNAAYNGEPHFNTTATNHQALNSRAPMNGTFSAHTFPTGGILPTLNYSSVTSYSDLSFPQTFYTSRIRIAEVTGSAIFFIHGIYGRRQRYITVAKTALEREQQRYQLLDLLSEARARGTIFRVNFLSPDYIPLSGFYAESVRSWLIDQLRDAVKPHQRVHYLMYPRNSGPGMSWAFTVDRRRPSTVVKEEIPVEVSVSQGYEGGFQERLPRL